MKTSRFPLKWYVEDMYKVSDVSPFSSYEKQYQYHLKHNIKVNGKYKVLVWCYPSNNKFVGGRNPCFLFWPILELSVLSWQTSRLYYIALGNFTCTRGNGIKYITIASQNFYHLSYQDECKLSKLTSLSRISLSVFSFCILHRTLMSSIKISRVFNDSRPKLDPLIVME